MQVPPDTSAGWNSLAQPPSNDPKGDYPDVTDQMQGKVKVASAEPTFDFSKMKVPEKNEAPQFDFSKMKPPTSQPNLTPHPNGVMRGAAERMLGVGQLANNIGVGKYMGLPPNDILGGAKDIAEQQGKGTGLTGFIEEQAGDPLNYIGGAMLKGAKGIGGLTGAGARLGAAEGLTEGGNTTEENLKNAGKGAGIGAVTTPLLGIAGNKLAKTINKNALPNIASSDILPTPLPEGVFKGAGGKPMAVSPKAVDSAHGILQTALKEDDINPLDVAQKLEEAKATGLPMTAADVLTKEAGGVQTHGKNALGLLKGTANMPGPGAAMAGEVAARGANTSKRIGSALDTVFSKKGVYEVSDEALKKIETETPVAYKKAFEGGSIAPLEKQFEGEVGKASQQTAVARNKVNEINNRLTQIEARKQTNANVYVDSRLIQEKRSLHDQLQKATAELSQAQAKENEVGQTLRQAQSDKSSGVKGAVWSPHIQDMLADDTVQKGIQKGLWIAKKEALANGEKFNPTEYGITGYDEAGEPIVNKVPNMRMLDAGKKGLDAIINENKNPLTGKMNETGRAVSMLKNSYLKEIDALNPDYASARKSYGDQASRLEALNEGRDFLKMDKEEISRFMKDPNVSNAEKAAFSVGARRTLQEMLDKDPTNPIRSIWRTGIKDKMEPLFQSKEAFDRFSKVMEHEQSMHRINSALAQGSHTNMLGNYQQAVKSPAKMLKAFTNPQGAAADMGMEMISKALAKKSANMSKDQAAVISRYLTTNDPALWYDFAQRMGQIE